MNYAIYSVKRPRQGPFKASRVSLHGSIEGTSMAQGRASMAPGKASMAPLSVSIGVSTAQGLASMAPE